MKFERRRFLRQAGAAMLGSGASLFGGYFYGTRLETEWLEVVRIRIPLRKGAALEGCRIVVMSDFHLYPHTRLEYLQNAVQEAHRLKPDLAVFLGDFVLSTAESIFDLAPALSRINAALGSFAVIGNHDIWKGVEAVREGLRCEQIPVLDNRGVLLHFGGQPFFLAGVDDAWSGRPDLKSALQEAQPGVPVILLSHAPDPADRYCRDERIILQLSGHSHGGQVKVPGYGSPFLPPFGRKYPEGLYRVHQSWLYTNRGLGVTVPIRLNCRPELTEITLVAQA